MFKTINKQTNIILNKSIKTEKPVKFDNKSKLPVKTEKTVKTEITSKIKRIINKITRKNQIVNVFDDFTKNKSWKSMDRSRSGFDKSSNTEQVGKSIYSENCSYYEISGLLGSQKRDAMGKALFTRNGKRKRLRIINKTKFEQLISDANGEIDYIKVSMPKRFKNKDYTTKLYYDNKSTNTSTEEKNLYLFSQIPGYKVLIEIGVNEKFIQYHIIKTIGEQTNKIEEVVYGSLPEILSSAKNTDKFGGRKTLYKLSLYYYFLTHEVSDDVQLDIKDTLHNLDKTDKDYEEKYIKTFNELMEKYEIEIEDIINDEHIKQMNLYPKIIFRIKNDKRVPNIYLIDVKERKEVTKLRFFDTNTIFARADLNACSVCSADDDAMAMFKDRFEIIHDTEKFYKNVLSLGDYYKHKKIDSLIHFDEQQKVFMNCSWNYFKTYNSETQQDYWDYFFKCYFGFDVNDFSIHNPFNDEIQQFTWESIGEIKTYGELFQEAFDHTPVYVEKDKKIIYKDFHLIQHRYTSDVTLYGFFKDGHIDYNEDHKPLNLDYGKVKNFKYNDGELISTPRIDSDIARTLYGKHWEESTIKLIDYKQMNDYFNENYGDKKEFKKELKLQSFITSKEYESKIISYLNSKENLDFYSNLFIEFYFNEFLLKKFIQRFKDTDLDLKKIVENISKYKIIYDPEHKIEINESDNIREFNTFLCSNVRDMLLNNCAANIDITQIIEELNLEKIIKGEQGNELSNNRSLIKLFDQFYKFFDKNELPKTISVNDSRWKKTIVHEDNLKYISYYKYCDSMIKLLMNIMDTIVSSYEATSNYTITTNEEIIKTIEDNKEASARSGTSIERYGYYDNAYYKDSRDDTILKDKMKEFYDKYISLEDLESLEEINSKTILNKIKNNEQLSRFIETTSDRSKETENKCDKYTIKYLLKFIDSLTTKLKDNSNIKTTLEVAKKIIKIKVIEIYISSGFAKS